MEAARLACGIVSARADGDRFAARVFAPRAHLKEDASAMCYLSPPATSAADKIEPSHAGRESA